MKDVEIVRKGASVVFPEDDHLGYQLDMGMIVSKAIVKTSHRTARFQKVRF